MRVAAVVTVAVTVVAVIWAAAIWVAAVTGVVTLPVVTVGMAADMLAVTGADMVAATAVQFKSLLVSVADTPTNRRPSFVS